MTKQEHEEFEFILLVQGYLDQLEEASDEIRRLAKLNDMEEFGNEIINDTVGIITKPTS